MYFPKLFDLILDKNDPRYTRELVAKLDDLLGSFDLGVSFYEGDFNYYIRDVFLTEKILDDLVELGILEKEEEEEENVIEPEHDEEDKGGKFTLIVTPNKSKDLSYEEYKKKKRQIDSFSIIYEKTLRKKSGALTLIDLKGYSKNVNNPDNNASVLLLGDKIQKAIDEALEPYLLNSYSGIEIKHNGDGWFLYFLEENQAYSFLISFINNCFTNTSIKKDFDALKTSLKCYIHHAEEIEKIYKVDTFHFDMEGKDVILIHMLEKPIENALYNGIIEKASSFIAVTEGVINKLTETNSEGFLELTNVDIDTKDTEGNSKVHRPDLKIYYKVVN